ncbi:transposase [Mitsuaria sp. WAJ17]|uniref:transposase n=1 Tax=Mitsuaria sp. WAJ17 TaxID=2761452 RepID=UPI002106563D|nr:transposase [Mitsuaria sp. WAJ17]
MRLASDALVKVYERRKVAKPDSSAIQPFRRSKFTLLKRPAKLTETQEQDLKQWLREDEDIAAAYKAKEAFYAIFDLPRDQAIQAFDHFRETVHRAVRKDFRQLLAKMKVWRSEMLAILDHPQTNAYTESINGAIQTIVRNGNGYKFDVVRARILAKHALDPRKEVKLSQLLLPEGNFCGYCHEQFSASEMSEVSMPPMVAGQPAIQTMVCRTCRSEFDSDVLKAKRSRRPTRNAE